MLIQLVSLVRQWTMWISNGLVMGEGERICSKFVWMIKVHTNLFLFLRCLSVRSRVVASLHQVRWNLVSHWLSKMQRLLIDLLLIPLHHAMILHGCLLSKVCCDTYTTLHLWQLIYVTRNDALIVEWPGVRLVFAHFLPFLTPCVHF